MAKLERFLLTIPGAAIGPESHYPIVHEQMAEEKESLLDEHEGLFVNYGRVYHVLPFAEQGDYHRIGENEQVSFDAYRLENDCLRAVFLPELGGRLWSLYDKKSHCNLVVENTAFQPCNFAVRGAWACGGVEWNFGIRGHCALTCDRIFAAPYEMRDGTPALRMYAFERTRALSYQMDFFMRDGEPFLFARMRIVNDSHQVKPVYWWSNAAVLQQEGARVIVPADFAYVNQGDKDLYLQSIPIVHEKDLSYPTNHPEAIDHFYKLEEGKRRYEAYVLKDGNGMIQTSTARLKGRKLFVWGMSSGGGNWQRFLTNEAGYQQPYVEIQAGLASTQNESLPMPPDTAWEWLEAYGPIALDSARAHGPWNTAQQATEEWLSERLPDARLEQMLVSTHADALTPVKPVSLGHGWGALENALRKTLGRKPLPTQLDFGVTGPDQALWLSLLKNGCFDQGLLASGPVSFMIQDEWFSLIKHAARETDSHCWFSHYQLGLCYYARNLYEEAADAFTHSLLLKPTSLGYHGRGNAYRTLGQTRKAIDDLQKALDMDSSSASLAREVFRYFLDEKEYDRVLRSFDALPDSVRQVVMIRSVMACALAYSGGT